MLRINSLKSASSYYTNSLTKGDYYSDGVSKNDEQIGLWGGLAAEKLGLVIHGNITKAQFDNLASGLHPSTGNKLLSRYDADRIEGYDFTFSVPKSISLVSAISRNPVFDDLIREAVKETMSEVERNIQTRVRVNGQNENRVTSNLVYGHFLHRNSRPIDGYSDPHLHIHAVILNLTYDTIENKWKGVNIRDKKENAPFYQSIFNSTLALKIQSLGLRIIKTRNNFELAGVDSSTIDAFSRRTKLIEKEIEQKGILSEKLKDQLGARTRKSKSDKHSQQELRNIYLKLIPYSQLQTIKKMTDQLGIGFGRLKELSKNVEVSLSNDARVDIAGSSITNRIDGVVSITGVGNIKDTAKSNGNLYNNYLTEKTKENLTIHTEAKNSLEMKELARYESARKWFNYTLNNVLERQSAVSEQRLIGEILKNGIGETNLKSVLKVMEVCKEKKILVLEQSDRLGSRNNISPLLTSQQAFRQEIFVVEELHKLNRYSTKAMLTDSYESTLANNHFLNGTQKHVIRKVLESRDSIMIIEGKAGTGKTTVLKEIQKGIQIDRATQSIVFLAPTIKAVDVLKLEGFENAMTVEKYLNLQNKPPRKLLPAIAYKSFRDIPKYTKDTPLDILIIDEASLVSIRQVERLLKEKENQWRRIIFVGDGGQHKSIERGDLFKLIKEEQKRDSLRAFVDKRSTKIEFHSLNTIIRQKDPNVVEAVEMLGLGQTERGILKFKQLGSVKEIHDDIFRANEAAKIYTQNLATANKIKQSKETITVIPQKSFADKLYGNISGIKQVQKLKEEAISYQKLTTAPNTLIITPTHSDGQIVHYAVRQQLKKEGYITKQDHTIETIRSLGWTKAQKGLESNYEPGQVIQFTGNIKEYKMGDRFEVVTMEIKEQKAEKEWKSINTNTIQETEPMRQLSNKIKNTKEMQMDLFGIETQNDIQQNKLEMKNIKTGKTQPLPIHLTSYFDVNQREQLLLSNGDLIQIQKQATIQDKNGTEHKTTKGSIYQIKDIDQKVGKKEGNMTLTNGWIIPADFGNLKSVYYSTSHSSQGQTVDHSVFYTTKESIPTINKEMVYVASSRFRLTNTILTPNLEQFTKQAVKGEIKPLAMDVITSPTLLKEHQTTIDLANQKLQKEQQQAQAIALEKDMKLHPENYIKPEPPPVQHHAPRMRMRR